MLFPDVEQITPWLISGVGGERRIERNVCDGVVRIGIRERRDCDRNRIQNRVIELEAVDGGSDQADGVMIYGAFVVDASKDEFVPLQQNGVHYVEFLPWAFWERRVRGNNGMGSKQGRRLQRYRVHDGWMMDQEIGWMRGCQDGGVYVSVKKMSCM